MSAEGARRRAIERVDEAHRPARSQKQFGG